MNNDNFNNENNNLENLDNNFLGNNQNQNNEQKQVENNFQDNNNLNLNNQTDNNVSFNRNQNIANNEFSNNSNLNNEAVNQNFARNNNFTNNNNGFVNNNNNRNINNNGFINNNSFGNNNGFGNNNDFTNNNSMNNMQFSQNGGNYYPGDFVLSNSQLNATRHKSEKGLYIASVIVNILFIIIVLTIFALNFDKSMEAIKDSSDYYSSSQLLTEDNKTQASKDYDDIDIDKELDNLEDSEFYDQIAEYAIAIIFIVPILLFAVAYMYAQVRSSAIKITPRQFPEVYELIVRYCRRLGIQEIPDAYVVQENGVLNAFSSFVLRKKYIQINADLFEIAYREYHDLKSIGFVIAHELSHIRLKHASFGYQLSIYWANYIPFLGTALSRAREYSCDRIAQVVSQDNGVEAIMSLYAGKHLYKRVNVQDYLDNIYNIKGFFVWIYNAVSTHPVLPKRLVALINRNYHGRLF